MAYQWPVSKIDLVNRALAATGNNLVNVAEDGSDEWNVCSPAYEDALAVLMEDYNWGFATKVATLVASPTAPTDTLYDTAYPLPADLVHIVWVKINDTAALYDILANQVVLNAQGITDITMKYVSSDNSDPTFATPNFVRALTAYVMSAIYRGLHGDAAQADRTFKQAETLAQYARTRYNQQKPKTALWNSRISAARRARRPWPPNPRWSG